MGDLHAVAGVGDLLVREPPRAKELGGERRTNARVAGLEADAIGVLRGLLALLIGRLALVEHHQGAGNRALVGGDQVLDGVFGQFHVHSPLLVNQL